MGNTVVTGMGIKAPGIENNEQFLDVLKNGNCTLSILHSTQGASNMVAGVVDEQFMTDAFEPYKRYPRAAKMAMAAAKEAVDMVDITYYSPDRIGVVLGTAAGSITEIAQLADGLHDLKKTPLHGVTLADAHTLANAVCEYIGATGTSFTITTGCTASLDAILVGQQLIEAGVIDMCIVGGVDALLNDWTANGFKKIRAITTAIEIEKAGIPFSTNYKGFAMSEGAGMLVLENEQMAQQRQQKIYGHIEKVVSRNEGLKLLRSDATGNHMLAVFRQAIGETIPTYINSQALGMERNDRIEQKISMQCFDNDVPITSIKGMIGHAFGAMGAIQIISALLSMQHQFIPPTIKTDKKGFEELPVVTEMKSQSITSVAVTTHSSSGNNACALVTAYKE